MCPICEIFGLLLLSFLPFLSCLLLPSFFPFSRWPWHFWEILSSAYWASLLAQLEKAMAPHFSTLAWKIPWMEEPGRLQSWGWEESDTTERLPCHFSLSCIGEGNGKPLRCSCLENPRDGGAWWAAVYGVTQSRTRLKWLSSSSSWLSGKKSTYQCRGCGFDTCVGKISLERDMATHSSTLAWGNPCTEEADGIQSMGLQRVGHDLATKQQQSTSYLIKCLSGWICLIRRDKGFLARSLLMLWPLSLSVRHFRRCMSAVCATNDIDFDHLVKVLNDRIIHCKCVFAFVMNKYLVGRYFETIQIPCFSSHFCPLTLTSFNDYFSATVFTVVFSNGHF